jgi:N-acetylglucosaminyldiphosphoundecaprenol N-acetyl-beta-D-mannosaminyltransferase
MQYVRGEKQDRVAGMDLMPVLMAEAAKANKSVFLIGSTTDIQQLIIKKASIELPDLKVAGAISPPFRPLSEDEKAKIVQEINEANPDFVFVSLGCPKQEKWMAEHIGKVNACMLGLGQAFNVYAGTEKRLPKWMRALSLEWVYRLILEPKRLWKRYLVNNTMFVWLVIKYILAIGRKKVKK